MQALLETLAITAFMPVGGAIAGAIAAMAWELRVVVYHHRHGFTDDVHRPRSVDVEQAILLGAVAAVVLAPLAWICLHGTSVRLGLVRACAAGWLAALSGALLKQDAAVVVGLTVGLALVLHRSHWRRYGGSAPRTYERASTA